MDSGNKKPALINALLKRLRDPVQLRALLTGVMVVVGYGIIYLPLDGDIAETKARLAKEQKRLGLARDIEQLRAQFNSFKKRLPEKPDPNEWVQYLLEGIRGFPVNLVALNTDPLKEVGPYKAVVLRMHLEGSFQGLNAMLRWLEMNQRLCRVDSVRIVAHTKDKGLRVMQLTLLGVMG
jgi:hypothetical protein